MERIKDDNFVPTVEDVLRVEPRLLQVLPKSSPSYNAVPNDDTNSSIQSNLNPTSNVTVELSADILMEITKYSSIKTVCALSQVCKHFQKGIFFLMPKMNQNLALSSDVVWERLLESDF